MVGVRVPERLEAGALHAWLRALEAAARRGEGVRAPLEAPPALLAAALNQGAAGLREAVVARLAVAAVTAGVSRLEVHLEHPTLIEALMEALHAHPAHITSLSLTLGPRTSLGGLLCLALRGMSALTTLALTPAASDEDMVALAQAAPPLRALDVAYCASVTDKGIRALLGVADDSFTMKEVLTGRIKRGGDAPTTSLTTVNLWGTEVTTRGCALLLAACPSLASLTCRWTGEALDLMMRGGREASLALSQLLLTEAAFPPLEEVTRVCPQLTSLVARRPPDPVSVKSMISSIPSLTAVTLLQFMPESEQWLSSDPAPALTYLHLSLLDARQVDLAGLADTCPALTHLVLEGVTLFLPRPRPSAPLSKLTTLRLVTPPTQTHVIDPEVAVWAMVWARNAVSVDLGSCKLFTDQHLSQALDQGALAQVEDLRLSGAGQVTDTGIDEMMRCCPYLRRLALKMLPKERLAELEALKVKIREENLDLELITYGWKF
ncbi:uncharacterized protein LOC125044219 [Penaeus chinensis]|uniref:uncharacterized protein LOC125044219 n=1 Tax=Penaeus chinensis TaxID=139456 RepID=UPI001FB5C265|nr:uncharacterized protein LOC125044219 [Penaeus chinensis]